jgi:hypothetical protein
MDLPNEIIQNIFKSGAFNIALTSKDWYELNKSFLNELKDKAINEIEMFPPDRYDITYIYEEAGRSRVRIKKYYDKPPPVNVNGYTILLKPFEIEREYDRNSEECKIEGRKIKNFRGDIKLHFINARRKTIILD